MVENRGDGEHRGREPRQAGVELMDGSAEREPGGVEGHGHQGHGGDDALDLEAQGLIGGDGDSHEVVNQFPAAKRSRSQSLSVISFIVPTWPQLAWASPPCVGMFSMIDSSSLSVCRAAAR